MGTPERFPNPTTNPCEWSFRTETTKDPQARIRLSKDHTWISATNAHKPHEGVISGPPKPPARARNAVDPGLATMCRDVAKEIPQGHCTRAGGGRGRWGGAVVALG
ncbi:hypothetical protein GCM10029964_029660 [Kibdelosporangium lantanae]